MIIVGTDYRMICTFNIDISGALSTSIKVQSPDNVLSDFAATVSGTNTAWADIPSASNISTGEHRVWAQVNYLGDVIQKSAARTFTVWPEGALQN